MVSRMRSRTVDTPSWRFLLAVSPGLTYCSMDPRVKFNPDELSNPKFMCNVIEHPKLT